MSDLPNDGDLIEFETIPDGSLVKAGVRYRVEHKAGQTEYLLVDVASGHAGRVPAVEFRKARWSEVQAEVEKPSAAPIAKPLADSPPPQAPLFTPQPSTE